MNSGMPGWLLEQHSDNVLIMLTDGSIAVRSATDGPTDIAPGDCLLLDDSGFARAPASIANLLIQTGKVDVVDESGWTLVSSSRHGTLRLPVSTTLTYSAGDSVEFLPGRGVTRVMAARHNNAPSQFLVTPAEVTETFADIVGRADETALMRAVIDRLLDPQTQTSTHGALFTGPPGTGKTMFAKALVNESPVGAYYYLRGPELTSKWLNESEEQLRGLFDHARNHYDSAIIFIDEIDSMAGARSSTSHSQDNKFVGQLLSLMTGVESKSKVLVIGATNRAQLLDPALLRQGRFSTRIEFDVPNPAARAGILTNSLPQDLVDDHLVNHLVETTAGWSGADIAGIRDQLDIVVRKDQRKQPTIEDTLLAHEEVLRARALINSRERTS